MDFVTVGNAGNAADASGYGAVAYEYRIGKYEVTNTQYVTFLNSVAQTDSFGLYAFNMNASVMGGITRSGTSGSFSYSVKPGFENMPVIFVTFSDAARFANWMGTGYTEGRATQGGPLLAGAAYDLNFVANATSAQATRLSGAKFFLPSEDEWYKAAYHQPAAAGGDADGYWSYATGSNTQPTSAPPGAGSDRANYLYDDSLDNGINGGYAVTQSPTTSPVQNYLTDVGAYGAGSESYYGTADQAGNVSELTDRFSTATVVVSRGGMYSSSASAISSAARATQVSFGIGTSSAGFRLAAATVIPEPSTYAAVAGVLGLACALQRRRSEHGTA